MEKIILNEAQRKSLIDVFTYTPTELIDMALNREEEIPELSFQSKAGTMQEANNNYQKTVDRTGERAEERQMIIFADSEHDFVQYILLYVDEDKESDELILAIRKMASIILGG